jgi:hypothetical protein
MVHIMAFRRRGNVKSGDARPETIGVAAESQMNESVNVKTAKLEAKSSNTTLRCVTSSSVRSA